MGVPTTNGSLKTDVLSMEVGDYISFNYNTRAIGVAGGFSNIGTATGIEIPTNGIAIPNKTNGNLAYFVKNDIGMLISDRIVQNSISWDTLNKCGYIEGSKYNTPSILIQSDNYTVKEDTGRTITSVGNPTINTTIKKMGNGSLYLNGSSCVNVPYLQTDYRTVELWFNYISCSKQWNFLFCLAGSVFGAYINTSGKIGLWYQSSGSLGATQLVSGTWYHCAVVMDGNTQKLYLNGQLEATSNFALPYGMGLFKVGSWTDDSNYLWNGYLDEIIVHNTIKYTGNFTPVTTPYIYNGNSYLIRSLGGGCAYTDINNNMSITNNSLGSYPKLNEYDRYISNNSYIGVAGSDSIWHWNCSTSTWCKDTPILSMGSASNRVLRGLGSGVNYMSNIVSSTATTSVGFRPVLEFKDNGAKGTTLWY